LESLFEIVSGVLWIYQRVAATLDACSAEEAPRVFANEMIRHARTTGTFTD
jgi:hypothetical protein